MAINRLRDVMAMQGKTLPLHVQQEFADYLKCGRLEHGFLRVQCTWSKPDTAYPVFICNTRMENDY